MWAKKFVGVLDNSHAYFHGVRWFAAKSPSPQALAPQGFQYIAPCFCLRLRWSAIIAMNSLFVGLPLMFDTV